MTDSRQLLAEYARNGSDAAFRELIACYVDMVYSTALRLVDGDAHRAQDVAQMVFADLARMAASVPKEAMPGGWLHRHTCFVAANVMRGERRRRAREQQAVEMNVLQDDPEPDRQLIAPILDKAINELGEAERMAILLRFFEGRDFASVGESLGSNADAARMRVNRALDKLRTGLKRRGVTTSAAALATVLTAGAVDAAPAGLAATISSAATLAGATAATSAVITTTKTIAMTTLQKTIIGAALAAAIGTGIFEARQAAKLRDQNQALQQQQASLEQQRDDAEKRLALLSAQSAPTLSAPPDHFTLQTNAPVDNLETNLFARYKNNVPKLTAAQIDAYLKANGRTATSLLAAYRTSGDPALLQEAMEKFPNDAQVAFEAALDRNLSPEEQRQWANTFEQDAPQNALGNYLSALNDFNAGQIDEGVKELAAASGKSLDDYTVSRAENDMEAYLSAGYPVADAEQLGTSQLLLPQLQELRQLTLDSDDLAKAYRQAGDTASADTVLEMADKLGQQYATPSAGEPVITQLVGIAIERSALQVMDPNAPYGDSGQTVQDRLNQLTQQRTTVQQTVQQVGTLMPQMSDNDWIVYKNRWLMFGEANAEQWVINKYGQQ